MKSILLPFFFLFLSLPSLGQDELPDASKELVEKLAAFSKDTHEKAEKQIQEKETQVLKVLKTHLQNQTKSGNLKGALAIQKVIEELSDKTPKPEAEETTALSQGKGFETDFFDHVWGHTHTDNYTWQFFKNGKGSKIYLGVPRAFIWESADSGVINVRVNGRKEYFQFGRRERDCWKVDENGKRTVQLEIKTKARKSE